MADDPIVIEGANGTLDYWARGAISVTRPFEVTNKPSASGIGTTFTGRRQPMTLTAEVYFNVGAERAPTGRNDNSTFISAQAADARFLAIQVNQFSALAGGVYRVYCSAVPSGSMACTVTEASIKDDAKWDNTLTGTLQVRELVQFNPRATDAEGFSFLGNDVVPAGDLPAAKEKTCVPVAALTYDLQDIVKQEEKARADVITATESSRNQYLALTAKAFSSYADTIIASARSGNSADLAKLNRLETLLQESGADLRAAIGGTIDQSFTITSGPNRGLTGNLTGAEREEVRQQVLAALLAKANAAGVGNLTAAERKAILDNDNNGLISAYAGSGVTDAAKKAHDDCLARYASVRSLYANPVVQTGAVAAEVGTALLGGLSLLLKPSATEGIGNTFNDIGDAQNGKGIYSAEASCPTPLPNRFASVTTRKAYIDYFNTLFPGDNHAYGVCAE